MKITRSELYHLVWTEPVTKVSHRFGLSGVGLKKIYDRLIIPTPGPGIGRLFSMDTKLIKLHCQKRNQDKYKI